jgi:glycosyltransferase involved in cell wall biosynthesis
MGSDPVTRIVQIVQFMRHGAGVPSVAANLDAAFRVLGVETEAFTYPTARQGKPDRPVRSKRGMRLQQWGRIVWFSTVGTVLARRFLQDRPDAVAICHGNALAGDIFVDHGALLAAMRAHGEPDWRYFLHPISLFAHVRDTIRYRSRIHRAVVVLTPRERETLRQIYGRVRPRTVVIPNGVDVERFRPPTAEERAAERQRFELDAEDRVALFVGGEFDRKGLGVVLEALVTATTVLLLVVGGDAKMVARVTERALELGVADRVLLIGQRSDPVAYFRIADMFVLPSAYESSGLVFLEALASGVPVIATRVGIAPDVVQDGVNGYLVERDPGRLADRMEQIAALADPTPMRDAARASALDRSWIAIAARYVELAEQVAVERSATR